MFRQLFLWIASNLCFRRRTLATGLPLTCLTYPVPYPQRRESPPAAQAGPHCRASRHLDDGARLLAAGDVADGVHLVGCLLGTPVTTILTRAGDGLDHEFALADRANASPFLSFFVLTVESLPHLSAALIGTAPAVEVVGYYLGATYFAFDRIDFAVHRCLSCRSG